jgi:hypothetical protein
MRQKCDNTLHLMTGLVGSYRQNHSDDNLSRVGVVARAIEEDAPRKGNRDGA